MESLDTLLNTLRERYFRYFQQVPYEQCMEAYLNSPTNENLKRLFDWESALVDSHTEFVKKHNAACEILAYRANIAKNLASNPLRDKILAGFRELNKIMAKEQDSIILREIITNVGTRTLIDSKMVSFTDKSMKNKANVYQNIIISLDNLAEKIKSEKDKITEKYCTDCSKECRAMWAPCKTALNKDGLDYIVEKLPKLKRALQERFSKYYDQAEFGKKINTMIYKDFLNASSSSARNRAVEEDFSNIVNNIQYFIDDGQTVASSLDPKYAPEIVNAFCGDLKASFSENRFTITKTRDNYKKGEPELDAEYLAFVRANIKEMLASPKNETEESAEAVLEILDNALETLKIAPKSSVFEQMRDILDLQRRKEGEQHE